MNNKRRNKVFVWMISLSFIIYHLSFSIACTDTWDDHYEGTAQGVNSGSLWEAIQKDGSLSNFASVIRATGYDKSLGSSQVFTVFAPTDANFSKQEADALIAQYQVEKQTVNDEDNTVIKEFVQNHIALYNHSVSGLSNDSIVLMNGKYAVLSPNRIDRTPFGISNVMYENGVLFTVDRPIDYAANVFEYLRKDADLDSVRSFLYNPMFYKKVFSPASSVEGGLDDMGRTVYLDSVFIQQNELFRYLGRIADEDSTLWMVAPTNAVWRDLVEQYTPYFNYSDRVGELLTKGDADSLAYTNTRLSIMEGTVFSQTINEKLLKRQQTTTTESDSLFSVNAVLDYNMRQALYGTPFNYYQYFNPLESDNGVLAESDSVNCSNGQLMKVSDWKINPLQTFNKWIVVEAENRGSVKEISKHLERNDSVNDATMSTLSVNNYDFRGKVWGNYFVSFVPSGSTLLPKITFNVQNVLSNMGYDIYLVMAPALANDSNATEIEQLPTTVRCTMFYNGQDGSVVKKRDNGRTEGEQLVSSVTTSGTDMSYLLLAEDFKFPVSTYNIGDDENPQVSIMVESRVSPTQVSRRTHTKTMGIDCLLLVPHGTLELVDALPEGVAPGDVGKPGVLMYAHGKKAHSEAFNSKVYYKLR